MEAWKRELKVVLTSTLLKKKITFGESKKTNLRISITGNKYLSSLKDSFTIKITNLTYNEIIQMIRGNYYDIEIYAGYQSLGSHRIFKGGVLYITNSYETDKSHVANILCTSNLIAKYGQSRMNLGLKSGINMYAAISFLCKRAGIQNPNIDEDFKNRLIREASDISSTVGSWLDNFATNNNFVLNSDESLNHQVSIWNPYRKDSRLIILDSSKIILTNGYPTLSSEGLYMTVLPTFNFMPGDTIQIDNSIIDISVTSNSTRYSNVGYYLDEKGQYMIMQIEYSLQNRGSGFSLRLLCKAKSLVRQLLSGGGQNG